MVLDTISTNTSAFVTGSNLSVGGTLSVTANDASSASAQTELISASLGLISLAFGGSVALVHIDSNVAAYIDASTVTAGAITVSASAQPEGSTNAAGVNAGTIAVGMSLAITDVTPHVSATVAGNITAGSLSILANVNLPTDGNAAASATAQGSVGGLIGIVATDTEVTNNDTALAGISQHQAANFGVATGTVVTVAGAILIVATGNSKQTANSSNSSVGLVALGGGDRHRHRQRRHHGDDRQFGERSRRQRAGQRHRQRQRLCRDHGRIGRRAGRRGCRPDHQHHRHHRRRRSAPARSST